MFSDLLIFLHSSLLCRSYHQETNSVIKLCILWKIIIYVSASKCIICVCVWSVYACVFVHVCVHVLLCMCLHVCMLICVSVLVCVSVWMGVCVVCMDVSECGWLCECGHASVCAFCCVESHALKQQCHH